MSVTKELFGKTRDGKEVYCYSIENTNKMCAKVITFGAILKNLYVPDKKGKLDDVVLGYDKLWMYFKNGSCFGSTIGPIANRTALGAFSLCGKKYQLPVNDRGKNNLHTDLVNGFHKRVWDAVEGKNSVTFSLKKKDGEMGHPGNMKVSVTYTLTDKNELKITYHADTDKKTVIKKNPKPFMMITALDDFYVEYEINAYTDNSATMPRVYSELHQNLLKRFFESGVEIMSPHIFARRDGIDTQMPANYLNPDKS